MPRSSAQLPHHVELLSELDFLRVSACERDLDLDRTCDETRDVEATRSQREAHDGDLEIFDLAEQGTVAWRGTRERVTRWR